MERTDDLLINNLKLIQDDRLFCFGHDAVELANFVSGTDSDSAADLCSGNGVIAVLLAGKKGIRTTAIEIDPSLAALAVRNAALNNLESMIDVVNLPIQRIGEAFKKGSRSIVVCNPPYFKKGSGRPPKCGTAGARHELFVTLSEVIDCAQYLLKNKGRFFMVYPADRLAELLSLCVKAGLEPKELVFLKSGGGKACADGVERPKLCLLKCVKGAGGGLDVGVREIRNY